MESKTIWFVLKSVCRQQDYCCHRGCPGSTSKQVFIKCMVCISLVCPLFKSFKCIRRALLYVELVLIARGASKAFGQFGLHLATDLYHYIILVNYGIPWRPFGIFNYEVNPSDKTHSRRWPFDQRFVATLRHFNRQYLRLNTRMVRHGATTVRLWSKLFDCQIDRFPFETVPIWCWPW